MALDRLSAVRSWTTLPRREAVEWLEAGRGSPADVAANLHEMWRLNRYLGGLSALTRHLYPRLAARPGATVVLDLGTGSAAVPLAIARWAQAHGRTVKVVGLDRSARSLSVARRHAQSAPALSLLRAEAGCLPLAPAGVDFVISTLLLHHFPPEAAVDLLRHAFAVARRGLVMSDLIRGRLPLLAFQLIQPLFARHPFTRHDGALSIQRAYTPGELAALAAAAGLQQVRLYTHWPWRMTLVAEHPE